MLFRSWETVSSAIPLICVFILARPIRSYYTVIRQKPWVPRSAPVLTAEEKKRKESIRREKERDKVDEQSWESFPASDPPASW